MARSYREVVSFRPTDAQLTNLKALRGTLPEPSWSATMRWLLDQPETQLLIEERCMEAMLGEDER